LLSRPILLVTIAPELPGSLVFIEQARRRGIAVALGHSDARAATVHDAVAAGATLATHLGNGVAHQMHKFDNPILAQVVEDGLWGCFIVDGIHVPPHALRMLTRTKTLAKSILVTDAVSAAGAQPGIYPLAGMVVERGEDGTVREKGATNLAGSSLTMDQGVRNLVHWGLCSFDEAIQLGSANPRKALAEGGVLVDDPGEVVWSDEHEVVEVRLGGRVAYRRL
jgi:N-acetylglucosamine-6-phosphate deacetylase